MLKGIVVLENGRWFFRLPDGEQYVFFSGVIREEQSGRNAEAVFTHGFTADRMGIVVILSVSEHSQEALSIDHETRLREDHDAERWDGLS